ncbi:hypothetical protein GTR02_06680 [Kineococcus sp. R8]|uniref:cell wall-binding repeat-containing protein n=1 Tax=Kineococcus siccus TaxID=2696567 RepID=UPI00141370E1|nr:cell wall-binding repeat-containing protein [Kineococcus siccus]NAZ81500.1 hypothetical protein [Kineococcus siccus]
MRTTTTAALVATVLLGAGLVTAGSAAADDTPASSTSSTTEPTTSSPRYETSGRAELRSSVTARGNVRLDGADRYATAVEISRATWGDDGAIEVVLASGTAFPDALAWGSAGYGAGPLLLTERDRLPEVTRTELERLRPCFVVVLGGPSAVSDAVFHEAERYADPSACLDL